MTFTTKYDTLINGIFTTEEAASEIDAALLANYKPTTASISKMVALLSNHPTGVRYRAAPNLPMCHIRFYQEKRCTWIDLCYILQKLTLIYLPHGSIPPYQCIFIVDCYEACLKLHQHLTRAGFTVTFVFDEKE